MGKLKIVLLGLSITSSWGNGHATTYRGLVRELVARGHDVLFLERDKPWYASARDLPHPPYGRTVLYRSVDELKKKFAADVRRADVVIVGSYVPNGVTVGEWVTKTARGVTAFYDIDTPITLAMLDEANELYLSAELVRRYHLYLSFTGGPVLQRLERDYGAAMARPLYCSVDPAEYFFEQSEVRWDLGYMGTYSSDRQAALENLMFDTARRRSECKMVIAGAQYPSTIRWPSNVLRIEHLPPARHRAFYGQQKFTLNLTRALMIRAGYSPSVRLFEAAACACPIISDRWKGLEQFLKPGKEILIADSSDQVLDYLTQISAAERARIGRKARARIIAAHTPAHRAAELEEYLMELLG
jgi:spore maturation protein CgeB